MYISRQSASIHFGAKHVFRLFNLELPEAPKSPPGAQRRQRRLEDIFPLFESIPRRLESAYADAVHLPSALKLRMPSTLTFTSPIPGLDGRPTIEPVATFLSPHLTIQNHHTFLHRNDQEHRGSVLVATITTRHSKTEKITGDPPRERFACEAVAEALFGELQKWGGLENRVFLAQLFTAPTWKQPLKSLTGLLGKPTRPRFNYEAHRTAFGAPEANVVSTLKLARIAPPNPTKS